MTDIVVPADLWEPELEGVLLAWLYPDGAEVPEGEVIVELMVEKVQHELEAPAAGVLRHGVEEEALIRCGQVIGTIE